MLDKKLIYEIAKKYNIEIEENSETPGFYIGNEKIDHEEFLNSLFGKDMKTENKPAVFNVLTGEFQSYEEFYGKEKNMIKYKIQAGLNGGFGGARFQGVYEFETEEEAVNYARELAIEDYEGYGGHHGLFTEESMRDTLIEDGDYTEDELNENPNIVEEAYKEDIENWIEWSAEECTGDCLNCNEESVCNQQDDFGNKCIL